MSDQPSKKQIAIIGAGLTGLVTAYALLSTGHTVVVLESALQPGGMISSFPMGKDRIEYIYHHVFTHDQELIRLLAELGLQNRLKWYKPRDALYTGRRLYPFSTPLDLLRFTPIPLHQRLRTGLTVLKAAKVQDWKQLEKETAAQWLLRNSGREAYERIWRPLLRAKFDKDAEEVSAVWIWNKFKLRGHSRDKDAGSEKLGYMDGSFGLLIDTLTSRICQMGGRLLTGHTVMNISNSEQGQGYRVSCILENCQTVNFACDALVATVSGRQFAGMSTSLNWPDTYSRKLNHLQYKGDLCLILRLRQPLSPYYWTTVCDDLPFVVVIEHTNLVSSERYGGHVVYLSRYLDITDPLWSEPDGAVFRQFVQGLNRLFPHFSTADVIDWRLKRTHYAQPVIVRAYSGQMPGIDTPAPLVKLAGMAQIYPEDRGMNYAVRLGYDAADALRRDLDTTSRDCRTAP
jgi:protoporphyrinogen oxidase